jgi:hypothetical protein
MDTPFDVFPRIGRTMARYWQIPQRLVPRKVRDIDPDWHVAVWIGLELGCQHRVKQLTKHSHILLCDFCVAAV